MIFPLTVFRIDAVHKVGDKVDQYQVTEAMKKTTFFSGRGSGKVACVPGWNWDHPVPFVDFDVWYVVAGEGRMTLSGRDFAVSRGSCIIIRPGERPIAVQNENDRLTIIFVHFHIADAPVSCLLPPRHIHFEDRYEVEWILHRLLEADEQTGSWSEMEFDSWMRLLLVQMYKREAEGASRELNAQQTLQMRKAARLIQERGGQIDVHGVAEAIGMSAPYLNRLFKLHAGMSVKESLVRSKLERAKGLLTESSMTVTQVALALEYADVYIFSKLFRKYYGLPPSHYVRSTRASGVAEGDRADEG